MVFPKISTKKIFEKKIEKKKLKKKLKNTGKKKGKFGWGFTVHLKSLPPLNLGGVVLLTLNHGNKVFLMFDESAFFVRI